MYETEQVVWLMQNRESVRMNSKVQNAIAEAESADELISNVCFYLDRSARAREHPQILEAAKQIMSHLNAMEREKGF